MGIDFEESPVCIRAFTRRGVLSTLLYGYDIVHITKRSDGHGMEWQNLEENKKIPPFALF